MKGGLQVFDKVTELYDAAALQWHAISKEAIENQGAFRVALAGGSTPQKLYERLTQSDLKAQLDWKNTHIYFGDERCVPQDHPDSNYRMVNEALLSRVSIPASQIHAMFDPAFSVEENARRYARIVDAIPAFDLVLLGMGNDGHTASLFPGTDLLDETDRTVAAQYVNKLSSWRISLTFPVINAAKNVLILVAGAGKAEMLAVIAGSDDSRPQYPIQRINPQGKLVWYLDREAAALLSAGTIS